MRDIFYNKKDNFILDFLLFAIAFSLPFSYAFNSISIGILFSYSFVFFEKKVFFQYLRVKKVYIFYIFFFLIQVGSIYYTHDKDIGLTTVIRNVLFLILPITFINLNKRINKNSIKVAFYGLLISVLITLISSYVHIIYYYFVEGLELSTFIREKFIEHGLYDIHAPYLALLIIFLLTVTYNYQFLKDKNFNKILKFFLIFFLTVSLIQVSGLMAIFIFSLFIINKLIFSQKTVKARLFFLSFIAILICSSLYFINTLEKQQSSRGAESIVYRVQNLMDDKDSVRQENWKSVLKVISSNYLFGIGADGGLNELQKQRDIKSEAFINKHNAHNDFLEILLRYGAVGLIFFFIILYKLIRKAVIVKNDFFIWFLVVFIISGLTESYLQRQIGLVFFTYFSLLFYTFQDDYDEKLNQENI